MQFFYIIIVIIIIIVKHLYSAIEFGDTEVLVASQIANSINHSVS